MIVISRKDKRQLQQQQEQMYRPSDELLDNDPTWGETFTASLGFVFDEELSVSSLLNNEMYARRDSAVADLANSGVDLRPYQDPTGKLDYDRIAKDMPDSGVGTNLDLYRERNSLLEMRRNYANDVKARGSGMAQFLGSMTGYMLDPVNVATLPIGASVSVLRGLSTMARVRRVAAIEAGIGAASELAIQPFVFAHKNEIGSPYTVDDAITAIATASAGGAILGGATAGIAGFLRNVAGLSDGSIDAVGSRDVMLRAADDLIQNPERMAVTESISNAARYYSARTSDEIAGEIQALRAADDLSPYNATRLEVAEAVLESRRGRWGKKVATEVDAARAVQRMPIEQRSALQDELTALRDTAEPDTARIAEIEAQLEEPDIAIDQRLQERLDEITHSRLVEVDSNYFRRLEAERTSPKKADPDTYEVNAERLSDDAYEQADIEAFDALDGDMIIRVGDDNVSAKTFVDERNVELEGLEAAKVCAIG